MEYEILYAVGTMKYYVVWGCFFIGVLDFLFMCLLSLGPTKRGKFSLLEEDWIADYNRGIFPVIGSADEVWSYDDNFRVIG